MAELGPFGLVCGSCGVVTLGRIVAGAREPARCVCGGELPWDEHLVDAEVGGKRRRRRPTFATGRGAQPDLFAPGAAPAPAPAPGPRPWDWRQDIRSWPESIRDIWVRLARQAVQRGSGREDARLVALAEVLSGRAPLPPITVKCRLGAEPAWAERLPADVTWDYTT